LGETSSKHQSARSPGDVLRVRDGDKRRQHGHPADVRRVLLGKEAGQWQ
jgi:hypothetical protein